MIAIWKGSVRTCMYPLVLLAVTEYKGPMIASAQTLLFMPILSREDLSSTMRQWNWSIPMIVNLLTYLFCLMLLSDVIDNVNQYCDKPLK